MTLEVACLDRLEMNARELMERHPPRFVHRNKKAVVALSCPPGSPHGGVVGYSRWALSSLPVRLPEARPAVVGVEGVFDYPEPGEGWVDWHVNFADPQLFVAYGGSLLAQDELQTLEHPALGALREALLAGGRPAVTEEADRATPVLVSGVERRCALDTAPDVDADRLYGLYGNRFARASEGQVRGATRVLWPPTVTNLLAMAAPCGGEGRYSAREIDRALRVAAAGFGAARGESARLAPGARVRVRTGFWGCGVFGGSRPLMAALQLSAARLAAIDEVVFYTFDAGGSADLAAARALLADDASVEALVQRLAARGFSWGQGDGN